jgi:hypothetical protein
MYSKEYVKYLKDSNLYKDSRRNFHTNKFALYEWEVLPKFKSANYSQIDWNKKFLDSLYETSTRITSNMLNSNANYMTVSSEVLRLVDLTHWSFFNVNN